MVNGTRQNTMPGTNRLLHISVLLPIASILILGLTRAWQDVGLPDVPVVAIVAIALLPALVTYLPLLRKQLGSQHLPVALAVYLVSQTILNSILHNLGLVRFDMVQLGPFHFLEPGVLLMLPPLLLAWEYGWKGALIGAASVGTIHLLTGVLLHYMLPEATHLAPETPILRPDVLYFLPLLVSYLSGLLRKQQKQQQRSENQLREYAATVEVLAAQRERNRLADQLQGTLGRSLAALNEQLEAALTVLGILPEATVERLQSAHNQVRSDLATTQQVITDLRPAPLDEMGLVEAIRFKANALAERQDIHVDFEASPLPEALTTEQERVLYHVVERALSHAEQHQEVHQVQLRLTGIEHFVALTVHDDGFTCRCQETRGSDDLEDVEACTQLIGGHLCYDSQGSRGNTLALWLPCGPREA
jgi:signal transduction histidine kinase